MRQNRAHKWISSCSLCNVYSHSAVSASIFSPKKYRYIASFNLSPSFILTGHSLSFCGCIITCYSYQAQMSLLYSLDTVHYISYAKNPTTMALQSLVPVFSLCSKTQARSTDGCWVLQFPLSVILSSLRCTTDNTYVSHLPFHVSAIKCSTSVACL